MRRNNSLGVICLQFNIAVCDDEKIYRDSIKEVITGWMRDHNRTDEVNISLYQSGEDLIEDWNRGKKFNLLFLDIEIPGEMNGINVARQFYAKDPYLSIVFVTNYSAFACAGYEVNALRYIMKPVTDERITECLDIVWGKIRVMSEHDIIVYEGSTVISLPIEDFMYAESKRHYLRVVTAQKREYLYRCKLSDFLAKANSEIIVKCHRSFAVNIMYVKKIKKTEITMTDREIVPLGKSYENQFYSSFMQFHHCKGGDLS